MGCDITHEVNLIAVNLGRVITFPASANSITLIVCRLIVGKLLKMAGCEPPTHELYSAGVSAS